MPNSNQRGFIAQLLLFLVLIAGLGIGIYLVQTRTGWFSKAAPVVPQKPETSFELEVQADTSEFFADDAVKLTGVGVGAKFRVDVWARSDIDPANLFEARIKFPTDLLQVVEINKRGANSFVNQWITDPSFDNSSGDISIIGGVNAPGLLTSSQDAGSVKGVDSSLTFDSRTMYVNADGSRTESITAYGKYWNFNSSNGWAAMDGSGSDLTSVARYASGPCSGRSGGDCSFDTRNIFVQKDGKKIETITVNGKYWNFDGSNGWAAMEGNGSDLTSVGRYANGPCSGRSAGTCVFDTRTMYYETDGARIESITAYGKYWNFKSPTTGGWEVMSGSGSELTSVSRYASGPCSGQSPCTFDSRTMLVKDGQKTESITAYGKYWNFNSSNGWAAMDGSGSDLTSVARYAQTRPTPVPIVIVTNAPVPNPSTPSVIVTSTPIYNPSPTAMTTITITMCNGQVKTWDQIDSELKVANYPGPFDHSQSEIDAYNRAACPSSSPTPTKSTLMMPRLMASIIFEAKKAGTAEIEVTDDSQILRNSDSINVISAKRGLKLPILGSLVSAPVEGSGRELICTNIAAALPLGKMPSGEDAYVVTGVKSVQLGVNATALAKITWKPVAGISFSSSSSNPTTITASAAGTYEIGATANWENPSAQVNCPNISVTFQSAPVSTPLPAPSVDPGTLRHDGDVNSDGKINLVDMSRILSVYGQKGQSEADLNEDEIVNSMDILTLRIILVQKGIIKGG